MSVELSFLLMAGIIVLLFGLKLYFAGGAGTGVSPHTDTGNQRGTLAVTQQFVQGSGWGVPVWLVLSTLALCGLLVLLLALELFTDQPLLALLAALIFLAFNIGLMRDMADWRARRFERQLIDALDMMGPALRNGNNVRFALAETAAASRGAMRHELQEVVRRLDMGIELDGALQRMGYLYDSEGVRLFHLALATKARQGGDLPAMLGSINVTLRERLKLRLQMNGQLSGVRLAAFLLAAAPHLLYAFFLWMQPQWISAIHEHGLGSRLLYAALAMQVAGMLWLLLILNHDL